MFRVPLRIDRIVENIERPENLMNYGFTSTLLENQIPRIFSEISWPSDLPDPKSMLSLYYDSITYSEYNPTTNPEYGNLS